MYEDTGVEVVSVCDIPSKEMMECGSSDYLVAGLKGSAPLIPKPIIGQNSEPVPSTSHPHNIICLSFNFFLDSEVVSFQYVSPQKFSMYLFSLLSKLHIQHTGSSYNMWRYISQAPTYIFQSPLHPSGRSTCFPDHLVFRNL